MSKTKQAIVFLAVVIGLVILGHLLGGADNAILHGPKLQFGF
jgi:hypothetical protein